MSTKSPAFQFYAADFLADEHVALMSNRAVGCYIKLICYCWREGSIPAEVDKLARLCGEDGKAMAELWPSLCECFEGAIDEPSRLVHPRLERERAKQSEFRAERSESGRRGANSRWGKEKPTTGSANGAAIKQPMALDGSSSSVFCLQSASKKPRTSFLSGKPDVTDPNAWKFQEPPPAGLEAHFLLAFLNKVTARKYRAVDANITPIRNRLKEASVDEVKKVIAHKANEWSGTEMEKYLRPETLFRASKFASYLGEAA